MRHAAQFALVSIAFVVGLVALPATAAADTCHFQFGSVPPGVVDINLLGIGFAPKAPVKVKVTRRPTGSTQSETTTSTVTTSAQGDFAITIDPSGATAISVEATDGTCTASGSIPASALIPTPTSNDAASPPSTDVAPATPQPNGPPWFAVAFAVAAGVASFVVVLMRPAQQHD
jgi:hypothetical protein